MKQSWMMHACLAVVLGLAMASCSSDEEEQRKSALSEGAFLGKWCSLDISGGIAVEMDFAGSHTMEGKIYTHLNDYPTCSGMTSGTWNFNASSSVLVVRMGMVSTNNITTTSYKVQKADSFSLQMQDQETGVNDVFNRLVAQLEGEQGVRLQLGESLPDGFAASSCVSTNSEVAQWTGQDGQVLLKKQGVAYLVVSNGQDNVVVKVTVNGRVRRMLALLDGTIDQVYAAYGTPDATGTLNSGDNRNPAVLYKNPVSMPMLSNLQVMYDETSGQVTRVWTKYNDASLWLEDASCLMAVYYSVGSEMYGDHPELQECKTVASPFTDNSGARWVNYLDQAYYKQNGHY